MTIKERYQRFRQWQKAPVEYSESTEEHHCCNCERDFHGNYCPTCGQKFNTGKVTWGNLRQEMMDLWGLGTRSLLVTFVQLLLRPGYLIGEYISGKRRNCFPPLSMLVLVALVITIIDKWLELGLTGPGEGTLIENPTPIEKFNAWMSDNLDYGSLFFFLMIIVPTYIIFRYAPRHTRHTLPQGFFIQVFNAIQFILLILVMGLARELTSSEDIKNIITWGFIVVLIPTYLVINYKQLFGYSVWGTIWRTLVCFLILLYSFNLIFDSANVILYGAQAKYAKGNIYYQTIEMIVIIILLLLGTYFINRRGYKKRMKMQDTK
jgi:hypothetical protein